jgi:predicted transcriptional regulator
MESAMSVRLNVVLSDDLNREIDRAAEGSATTKSEIMRKALHLYLVARDGTQRGLHVGLASETSKLETEFVGL